MRWAAVVDLEALTSQSGFWCISFAFIYYHMDDRYQAARDFLDLVYPSLPQPHKDKPWVTLTYAQSLDGMIAKHGQQLLLSGPESMAMTHR